MLRRSTARLGPGRRPDRKSEGGQYGDASLVGEEIQEEVRARAWTVLLDLRGSRVASRRSLLHAPDRVKGLPEPDGKGPDHTKRATQSRFHTSTNTKTTPSQRSTSLRYKAP